MQMNCTRATERKREERGEDRNVTERSRKGTERTGKERKGKEWNGKEWTLRSTPRTCRPGVDRQRLNRSASAVASFRGRPRRVPLGGFTPFPFFLLVPTSSKARFISNLREFPIRNVSFRMGWWEGFETPIIGISVGGSNFAAVYSLSQNGCDRQRVKRRARQWTYRYAAGRRRWGARAIRLT